MSHLNDLGVKSYIFGYEESEFSFCETEYPRWRQFFKMAAFPTVKITFRSSFATTFAAVAEYLTTDMCCVVDVVPVFYNSSTSSGWISGTGHCNRTWFW